MRHYKLDKDIWDAGHIITFYEFSENELHIKYTADRNTKVSVTCEFGEFESVTFSVVVFKSEAEIEDNVKAAHWGFLSRTFALNRLSTETLTGVSITFEDESLEDKLDTLYITMFS